jgi:hypothetical protein
MPRTLSAILLLLSFLAAPAAAVAETSGFELVPHAGWRTRGEIELDEQFDPGLEVDEGEMYGLAFDIPITRSFKIELLVNRQESALIVDEGLFGVEDEIGDLDISYAHVGVLYQWQLGHVQPFVVASAGITRLDPQFDGLSAEDRPSISIGGGVKVFFTDTFGMRFEGRGYGTALDETFEDDDFCDDFDFDDDECDTEDTLAQLEATVGLVFTW